MALARHPARTRPAPADLIDYAGAGKTIQIIPYAATSELMQLIDTLESEYGLTVELPETPARDHLWLRDYVDCKIGYRVLAGRWLPDADQLLPEGFACQTVEVAADAAFWFLQHDRACLVKSDIGENGIGNVVLKPGDFASAAVAADGAALQPFLDDHWLTVEEMIAADQPALAVTRNLRPARRANRRSPTFRINYFRALAISAACWSAANCSTRHGIRRWPPAA